MPSLFNAMSTQTRVLIVTLACFALTLAGVWGLESYHTRQAEESAAAVRTLQTIAQEKTIAAQEADARVVEANKIALDARLETERLRKKLNTTPLPPKPEDPPAEDTALAARLREDGMLQPPALRQDAVLVWNWRQTALTVPAWEERMAVCLELTKAQDAELLAGRAANTELREARDKWKATADNRLAQTDSLQQEVKALHQAATADKYKRYLLIGGALAAGYFAGKGK